MSLVKPSVMKDLKTLLGPLQLKSLADRLGASSSSPTNKSPEFYSTKTSFQTTKSTGLRRPIRTKQSLRAQSPVPNNFSKTVGTSSLQPNKQRAIFYRQESDLPNLHSQDLITTLYRSDSESPEHQQQTPWSRFASKFQNINRSLTSGELANLKELQLYYCNVESFRSLGTGWKIRSLTIIGANLTDFGGISGFAFIEDLFVSYNRISDVSHLSYHQTLRSLDLEGNIIADMDQVDYLETVENLEYVNIDHNPIIGKMEDREILEKKFGSKLEQGYAGEQVDEDGIWDAYEGYEEVALVDHINQQLLQDRIQNSKSEVILSLQQQHIIPPSANPSKMELPAPSSFLSTPLHTLHKPSSHLCQSTLSYLDSKLLPENMVDGSRSRSKPKLSEILSKDKLLKKDSIEENDSAMRESKMSFKDQMRETIRQEAKKKFLVRRGSIKKDGDGGKIGSTIAQPRTPLILGDSTQLGESIKVRTGRLMLKSCVNRL